MGDVSTQTALRVRFGVLGPFVVSRAGETITLGSPKQRAVLGILLTRAGGVVSTDRLIDDVWGDDAAPGRQNALWVHISNLRKALASGPDDASVLVTRAPGYVLDATLVETDAQEFERLVSEGRSLAESDPDAASLAFGEALSLWRGSPYADFAYEPWAQTEIARLEELRLEAVENRVDADLRRGLSHELVGELEGLVQEHPTRERLAASLMLALYRSGRAADALRAYQRLRGRVGDELGIEPSASLQRLHDRIVTNDPGLDVGADARRIASGDGGLSVRGYELRECLGERGSGVVHRAFQPAVGREVVIKVISSDLADSPDFIRRFDDEAQLVARLEHPHIVPLYDYWREPGAAYLVMRAIDGGKLTDFIDRGPATPDVVAQIADQVGAALETAHLSGVAHGNVTPENILLDEFANAYLADFEIATRSDLSATSVAVTREFSAFDDRRSFAAGDAAADIAGLAECIAQAVTGRREVFSDLLVGLDGALADALHRAHGDEAGARFDDAGAFRRAVVGALRVERADVAPVVGENPYKGLRSFGQHDASDFFGRERFIARLVNRLEHVGGEGRFTAVVGPSGSGKSSVVRAGLLPSLRRGAVAGSDDWFVVEMVPGAHPFEQLEQALLGVAVNPPPSLLEQLSGENGIRRAVERILPEDGASLLILVDQFEELFTQSAPDEAQRFLDAIVETVADVRATVRFVVTLRADFYDRPLRHRGLGELLRIGTEVLTPMSPEDLERAVSGPAERVGARCEPALVGELVAAALDRPTALPLLQYTLTELFERRSGAVLTMAAYREIGGVSGALVDRAEAIFVNLDTDEQYATREIFLRLVTLGEGADDTRRRVRLSELAAIDGVGPLVQRVTDTFTRHRLLGFDRDPVTRGPTVEIAHEALLTAWGRLSSWIEDARSDVRAERRLAEAAAEWAQHDRDPAFVLIGGRLARYEGWSERPPVGLTAEERDFLDVSEHAQSERLDAEANEARREAALRRRSRLVAVLAIAVAGFVALATFAVIQQRRASDLASDISRAAEARRVAAASQFVVESDPELATMLALESARLAAPSGAVPPEVLDSLHRGMFALGVEYPVDAGQGVHRPSAGGGIYPLSPDELIELAQQEVSRPFAESECSAARLLNCGDPRDAIRTGLTVDGGDEAYFGLPSEQPLAGAVVEIITPTGSAEREALSAEFAEFTERTGIFVEVRTQRSGEEGGELARNPTGEDVITFPQPGALPALVAGGHIVDVGRYLDRARLEEKQSPYLTSLLSVADDETWPASTGGVYGVWDTIEVKSLLWYDVDTLAARGAQPPSTWREMMELSDAVVADGDAPFCFSMASGDATGWRATDLLETVVLLAQGPEFYDRWTFHDVAFDDPAVVDAGVRLERMLLADDQLPWSRLAVPVRPFEDSIIELVEPDPAACAMSPYPSWPAQRLDAGEEFDVVEFPSITPEFDGSVMGGGTYSVALNDRPEVRAVIEFIASTDFGETRVDVGRFAANSFFELDSNASTLLERFVEPVRRALANNSFRFDASDLMPEEIGTEVFWQGMVDWFVSGPGSIERILGEIEARWPTDE